MSTNRSFLKALLILATAGLLAGRGATVANMPVRPAAGNRPPEGGPPRGQSVRDGQRHDRQRHSAPSDEIDRRAAQEHPGRHAREDPRSGPDAGPRAGLVRRDLPRRRAGHGQTVLRDSLVGHAGRRRRRHRRSHRRAGIGPGPRLRRQAVALRGRPALAEPGRRADRAGHLRRPAGGRAEGDPPSPRQPHPRHGRPRHGQRPRRHGQGHPDLHGHGRHPLHHRLLRRPDGPRRQVHRRAGQRHQVRARRQSGPRPGR